MYAVIETGGKQYTVQEGDILFVEKLPAEVDSTLNFEKVLAFNDNTSLAVGSPYLDGIAVTAKVLKNGKGKKIFIFKMKAKKNYRNRQGHRQPYTKVQIERIAKA